MWANDTEYPPALMAAAILYSCRRSEGHHPTDDEYLALAESLCPGLAAAADRIVGEINTRTR